MIEYQRLLEEQTNAIMKAVCEQHETARSAGYKLLDGGGVPGAAGYGDDQNKEALAGLKKYREFLLRLRAGVEQALSDFSPGDEVRSPSMNGSSIFRKLANPRPSDRWNEDGTEAPFVLETNAD